MKMNVTDYETAGAATQEDNRSETRSPIICFICNNYYDNPCILSCYHAFCSHCIETRLSNDQILCPICGSQTECKGTKPPIDPLITKLIDIFNVDNPPCANCDKRNRSSMFFCSTCGQALCNECRESIHKAKMFSTHDIMPMSKFCQDGLKKCNLHGEPYIMYSNSQHIMLCMNCFRDISTDTRHHCMDIETAYTQNAMKLESSIVTAYELQKSIRDGIIQCKSHLDELNHSADSEKMTVHNFAHGLQEAINKTQSALLSEIQRQYENKERSFHNQLVSLSSTLPVIQQYVNLCQHFASTLNKFQFLEVAYLMIDRLAAVTRLQQPIRVTTSSQIHTNYRTEFAQCLEPFIGKLLMSAIQPSQDKIYEAAPRLIHSATIPPMIVPPSLKQHPAVKAKALEGDSPFANHCRSFNGQLKELTLLMKNVKDRLSELRKQISLLYRTSVPPLLVRYQNVTQDCLRIRDALERNWSELDKLNSIFQSVWQEQICRIHVEQDVFHSQMNEVANLRVEFKQLITTVESIEPCISQLASSVGTDEIKQLKLSLYELQQFKDSKRIPKERKSPKSIPPESKPTTPKTTSPTETNKSFQHGSYDRKCDNQPRDEKCRSVSESKTTPRGVLSQIMDKVRKSPVVVDTVKERSKSEHRIRECEECRDSAHQRIIHPIGNDICRNRPKRICSLYHSFGGYKTRIVKNPDLECQMNRSRPEKSFDNNYSQPEKLPEPIIQHSCPTERTKDTGNVGQKWKELPMNKGCNISGGVAQKQQQQREKKESDYQSINETSSCVLQRQASNRNCYSSDDEDDVNTNYERKKNLRTPRKRSGAPSPPPRRTRRRRYPHSDTEDAAFYTRGSRSRRGSSMEIDDNGKTFVVVIGTRKKGGKYVSKQHSWETFPPKRKIVHKTGPSFCYNPETFSSHFDVASIQHGKIKKADSFEGHEEAVSSLVQEFQKIRMLEKQKQTVKNIHDGSNESPL